MKLRSADERYEQARHRPVGLAVDMGTGGCRGALYWIDTGEWIGDEPIVAPYYTSVTAHDPPHVLLNARDTELAFKHMLQQLLQRDPLVSNGRLKSIAIGGHMHAPFFIEHDGKITRPVHMWNSAAAAEHAARIREHIGWMVPDRATVSHILRECELDPEAFRHEVAMVTTQAGLVGFRLTGRHGLDSCEHSGLGTADPASGEFAPHINEIFGLNLQVLTPALVLPKNYLGNVGQAGCAWMGVSPDWAEGAVVAAPGGDQGYGRDGNGLRMHHAGLILGSSVVLTTETEERPEGDFDPFRSAHGNCLNMGLFANGLRTGDPLVAELIDTPEFDGDHAALFAKLGQEADSDPHNCVGAFAVAFNVADPGLGVSRRHIVEPPPDRSRGHKWRLIWMQLVMSIERRLEGLCGDGEKPKQLVVGGAAARDNHLLQTIADGLDIELLRPAGADMAMLNGARARGLLAEELAFGNANVDPKLFMYEVVPEPTGDTFTPRAERARTFNGYRERFQHEIELAS